MEVLLTAILLLSPLCSTQPLDPEGSNVCHNPRQPHTLVCCTGWRQDGKGCTKPVCEGEHACHGDEVCAYPGVCSCPPGYYGAQCKTRCPAEFWGPDCRRACPCHPHGRCLPATGECVCHPNHWGPLCQNACRCGRHGRCHPTRGDCTCDEGWWTATCARSCQCSVEGATGGACDQLSGGCRCHKGHWAQKCSLSCDCHQSPCTQRTGVCECHGSWWGVSCDQRCACDLNHSRCDPLDGTCLCQPGFKGAECNRPCEEGTYGSGCKMSCGYCQGGQSCDAADGACAACQPGWNGTRCDQPCPAHYYGEGCQETCPRCRDADACHPRTGKCARCDPGWRGPRCEEACSDRTYGDACRFLCSPCFHGNCHHVTGRCVCEPGFMGESCNSSCPASLYGRNCSSACDCGEGVGCHPTSGACPSSGLGALLAGVLVPVFLMLLVVLCCCVCCGGGPAEAKDRVSVSDGSAFVRMKYHVYNVLANISASLPCISAWTSGLPRVTVSHHDPELNFNHSFIEPPSCGWVTEGSSFDSDEEEEEALYCVPPREDGSEVAGGDFHEMSSKCNMFLDPSSFSSEDMNLGFSIPRTSSIAKYKRPSVSFAEGTRFSPKERCGSAQDQGATTPPSVAPRSKAKSPWGALMLSTLNIQGGPLRSGEADGVSSGAETEDGVGENQDSEAASSGGEEQDNEMSTHHPQAPGMLGRRHTTSNAATTTGTGKGASTTAGFPSDPQAGVPDKVTTVYVTVGRAGRPTSKLETPSSEGPVQAILRRLGSLQRHKEQESARPKVQGKSAEGIAKPPRRKLGVRASVWEEGEAAGGEGRIPKPSRKKPTSANSAVPAVEAIVNASLAPECDTPARPLLALLNSVLTDSTDSSDRCNRGREPAMEMGCSKEATAHEETEEYVREEPSYENVLIKHS
ncbi:hypothetical protein NHX12_008058 [Muraenolepis orangiensis]|uniref:EGF-like domain-containing protein n=1 Tax=Muraenolepis orangiensis TaxID=630683 RepID=A0A9Q0DJ31_9TELE|nr:hypothetical protein NHX12_008058 [Muraenolepis orangiensis]